MKLKKPPYLEVAGSAFGYRTQADHRRTALKMAMDTVREAAESDAQKMGGDISSMDMAKAMGEWVIESLVQGAFLREYHVWEKDTKEYFNGQKERQGEQPINWRDSGKPYTNKIAALLATYNAYVDEKVMSALDLTRKRINDLKHEPGLLLSHYVRWEDVEDLFNVIGQFWDELDRQEEFTPPVNRAS